MVNRALVMRELVDYAPSPGACGVGACTCTVPTLDASRDTSPARMDRIQPAWPPWPVEAPRPRIKKNHFSAPSTCPIDPFGPLANRTILERLHVAFLYASVLQALARCACKARGCRQSAYRDIYALSNARCSTTLASQLVAGVTSPPVRLLRCLCHHQLGELGLLHRRRT